MSEAGADRPLESRVEDLFSNAVERQVAERRAVGRALEELGNLVKSLDERLGRLENGDLGPSIANIQNHVGEIRSRLDEQVTGPVAHLSEQIDDRLTRLEAAEGARDREARDQVSGLAEQVNAFSARLHDIVAEGVEQLSRRQDENQQSLERAVLSAASGQVAPEPLDVEELANTVAARIPVPPAVQHLDLDAIAEAVVARIPVAAAPVPVDLDAVADAVIARMPVQSQPEPVDVGVIAQAVVERMRDVVPVPTSPEAVADAVSRQVPTAMQVASAVDASIRDGLVSVVDDVRDEVDRLRDELFAIRHEVADGVSGIQPLSARLGTDIEDLTEAVAGVRMDVQRSDGDRDRLRDEVTEVIQSLSADLRAAAEDRERQADVISDRLTGVVEGRLADAIDTRLSTMDGMRQDMASAIETLQGRMDLAVQDLSVVADLGPLLSEQSARLDRLAIELPAGTSAAFDERAGSLATEVQGLVRELATELGSALAAVAERAEAAQKANAGQVADIQGTVAGFDEHLGDLRDNSTKVAADLAAQTAAMQAMTGDVTTMGDTLGRVIGEMQAQLAADQEVAVERLRDLIDAGEHRLDRAAERVVNQTDQAMERLAAATEAVAQVSEGLRDDLAATLEDTSSAVRADAEEARDEVIAAGARLDLLFDRLAGFERALIDHLAARDQQFSYERALIVEDLVEQLAGGLGKRERKRLAAKVDLPTARAAVDAVAASAPVPEPVSPEPGNRDVPTEVRPARERHADETDLVPKVTAGATKRRPPAKKPPAKKPAAKKPAAKKPAAKKPASSKGAAVKSTRVTRNDLVAVKGLGPAKVDALIDAFGSPAKVAGASVEELAAVPGVGERLAKSVHDALR